MVLTRAQYKSQHEDTEAQQPAQQQQPVAAAAEQRLGRGCRVTRTVTTLDEQYLHHSLMVNSSNSHHTLHTQVNGSHNNNNNGSSSSRGVSYTRRNAGVTSATAAGGGAHGSTRRRSASVPQHGKSMPDTTTTTTSRYPPREAAQRALTSLKDTFHYMDTGEQRVKQDTNDDDDDDAADDKSKIQRPGSSAAAAAGSPTSTTAATSQYNFRHHPEIALLLARRAERDRSLDGRRRRRRRDGSTDSENYLSSSSSSSSNSSHKSHSSSSSSSSRAGSRRGRRRGTSPAPSPQRGYTRSRGTHSPQRASPPGSPTASASHGGASSSWHHHQTTATAGAATTNAEQRKRTRDVSIDSSITASSLRDESVERMARRDAPDAPSSSSDDDDDVATAAEAQRAARHARESVEKNIRINYYLADAIGPADPHAQRRRRLDLRYKLLFRQDEERKLCEAAAAEGGGGGGGGYYNGSSSGSSGGANSNNNGATTTGSVNATLGDISPLHIDADITFDRVGGLPGHIVTLREMVLLPLLYPALLHQLHLTPPRGVLFVGPPGTGKTLLARALANEGTRLGQRRVTFFMRKGADLLSKWVGESERQLHLLFAEAKRQQPSIIFFDEMDGLAPTRHTKTEQTQAALVATLLALLDGLDDRGQVVVIGATNRPDTLDPALRRPGRFDRELYFPLPDAAARRHILCIVTRTLLPPSHPQRDVILDELVAHTEGYTGADLSALCTEAGLHRLRTALPQLYTSATRLRVPHAAVTAALHITRANFAAAAQRLRPALRRGGAELHATSMQEHLECLFHGTRERVLAAVSRVWPTAARARAREQRDCGDVQRAVRELAAYDVPHARQPLLLLVQSTTATTATGAATRAAATRGDAAAECAMVLHNACVAVMRGLPTFATMVVHLPHLRVDFAEAAAYGSSSYGGGGGGNGGGDGAATGQDYLDTSQGTATPSHMYALVQAIQRAAPCVVLLRGAEEWLRDQGLVEAACEEHNNSNNSNSSSSTHKDTTRRRDDDSAHAQRQRQQGEDAAPTTPSRLTADKENATATHTAKASTRDVATSPPPPPHRTHTCSSDDEDDDDEAADDVVTARYGAEEVAMRRRRMRAWRYYINLLADTEVLLLLPCATATTWRALFDCPVHDSNSNKKEEELSSNTGDGAHAKDVHATAVATRTAATTRRRTQQQSTTPRARRRRRSTRSSSSSSSDSRSSSDDDNDETQQQQDDEAAATLTQVLSLTEMMCGNASSSASSSSCLLPTFRVLLARIPPQPHTSDVRRFAAHLHRNVTLALSMHAACAEATATQLTDAAGDNNNDNNDGDDEDEYSKEYNAAAAAARDSRSAADRAAALALWRRIDYRRLQLRHVLTRWVGQYISSGRYKLFMSADLDLTPGHPLYRAWQRHTRTTRIGLQDVMCKLEDEAYTCLSQYHEDIDMLVGNVRSFFRARAPADQRYRLRALELKETVVLSLYKINRNVVRFCEEHAHVQPPPELEESDKEDGNTNNNNNKTKKKNNNDSDGDDDAAQQRRRTRARDAKAANALTFPRRTARDAQQQQQRRRPHRYYAEHRRRRRGRTTKATAAATQPQRGSALRHRIVLLDGANNKQPSPLQRARRGGSSATRRSPARARSASSSSSSSSSSSPPRGRGHGQRLRGGRVAASVPPPSPRASRTATMATRTTARGRSAPLVSRRGRSPSLTPSTATTTSSSARSHSRSRSRSNSDGGGHRASATRTRAPSPRTSPTEWAAQQLRGLTFYALHRLFQLVMTALEQELRAHDACVAQSSDAVALNAAALLPSSPSRAHAHNNNGSSGSTGRDSRHAPRSPPPRPPQPLCTFSSPPPQHNGSSRRHGGNAAMCTPMGTAHAPYVIDVDTPAPPPLLLLPPAAVTTSATSRQHSHGGNNNNKASSAARGQTRNGSNSRNNGTATTATTPRRQRERDAAAARARETGFFVSVVTYALRCV